MIIFYIHKSQHRLASLCNSSLAKEIQENSVPNKKKDYDFISNLGKYLDVITNIMFIFLLINIKYLIEIFRTKIIILIFLSRNCSIVHLSYVKSVLIQIQYVLIILQVIDIVARTKKLDRTRTSETENWFISFV